MQEEATTSRASTPIADDAGEAFTIQPRQGAVLPGKLFPPARRGEQRQSSAQRQILATLQNADFDSRHLSIDDIFRHLMRAGEKISHSTIYRTLARMEAEGQVIRHQFVSGASVFEFPILDRHNHFVEVETSKIVDFQNDELEQLMLDIAEKYDVELVDYKMVLFVRPTGDAATKGGDNDN